MRRLARCLSATALCWLFAGSAAHERPPSESPGPSAPSATPAPSAEVQTFLAWLAQTQDHEGRSFAVLDKRQAQLWLFDEKRRPLGSTPVLLGTARGDASVPGIGERALSTIRPEERTTPAGRFALEPGVNDSGEDIFWVDYAAAVSLHRVRANKPAERRLQRLATPTPADNRISYGCINVPAAYYDQHLRPRFSLGRGVLYVLPETLPLQRLFNSR